MDYDSLLHRPIANGRQFDRLIPKIKCEYGFSGEGDTDLSIKNMEAVVKQFSWQMTKVATALKTGSFDNDVDRVFAFCHDHFQYKADGEDQMLRSPACSWSVRYDGIDCKSYSIIASSILREMGITHYIRKIRQPGFQPDQFTHVYVVVPVDQDNADLDYGYYVIDGTVPDNIEPIFIGQPSDLLMSGLKHYSSLNGVAPYRPTALGFVGLSSGPEDEPTGPPVTSNGETQSTWGTLGTQAGNIVGQFSTQKSSGFWKKINFKSIGNWFSTPLSCWGGTAYNDGWLQQDVDGMTKYCQLVIDEINVALATGNMTAFSNKVTELRGMVKMFVFCVVAKIGERPWNGCSVSSLQKVALAAQFYHEVMLKAFDAWLGEYFNAVASGSRTFTFSDVTTPNNIMPFCGWAAGAQPATVTKNTYSKKTENVPVFQGNEYLYSLVQTPTAFEPKKFLQELQDAYNVATNPGSIITGSGNTNGSGSTGGSGGGVQAPPKDPPKPTTASTGWLVALLAIGAIGFAFTGSPETKKSKP